MIITKKIEIKSTGPNKKYYESLGYDTSKETLSVNVNHLKRESNYIVECRCADCGNIFNQRFSRNTEVCSECRKHHKRKKFKKSDNALKYPQYKSWENDILSFNTKKDAINFLNEKYSVNLNYITFNEICKRLNIFIGFDDYECILNDISDEMYLEDICEKYNVKSSHIRSICKKQNIDFPHGKWTRDRFENRKTIENDLDYILKENETKDIPTIIKENGYTFSDSFLRQVLYEKNINIKSHSYNKSKGELEIMEYIKSLDVECYSNKFKTSIGVREIDCYCPEKNVGFEFCGLFWHSINSGTTKKYHQEKTLTLKNEFDIDVVTIFENEWINNKDLIKSMIKSRLGKSQKIFGRKCNVGFITSSEAKIFHNKNHINGYVNSSINVGLYYDNELVGVSSFSKSRFDKNYEYEITRMSFKIGYNIIGGASKMFKHSGLKSVITYADLRFGFGRVYEKLGFNFVKYTNPNYFYCKKDSMNLENRMNYQKHKLENKLEVFDKNLTEYENMARNNFLCIYDCGNAKYVF